MAEVERVSTAIGYPDRRTSATDMVFVGLGIFLGGLFGLLSLTVWGIPLTLTASGGALFMGLLFGWLRSAYPFFGRIPEPAIWIFDTVGLCMFIGIVGLSAGPSFVAGLKATGISLAAVGLVSALLPHMVGILFGRYVLKMDPLIVLGACAGAGTITAALRAGQGEGERSITALGYTGPYSLGEILPTPWGPVLNPLMNLLAGMPLMPCQSTVGLDTLMHPRSHRFHRPQGMADGGQHEAPDRIRGSRRRIRRDGQRRRPCGSLLPVRQLPRRLHRKTRGRAAAPAGRAGRCHPWCRSTGRRGPAWHTDEPRRSGQSGGQALSTLPRLRPAAPAKQAP